MFTQPLSYLQNFPYGPGGSIYFGGQSYLTAPASSDWAIGTGDFTIEWFYHQTTNVNENFFFDLGISNELSSSISINGTRFNFYMNGSRVANPPVSTTINNWYHFAISRKSGVLKMFKDGLQIFSARNTISINNTTSQFYIGCKDPASPDGDIFPGYLTNFRFVKGICLYNSSFTRPTAKLRRTPQTKLLLLAYNNTYFKKDSSILNKTVTNHALTSTFATWSSLTPF